MSEQGDCIHREYRGKKSYCIYRADMEIPRSHKCDPTCQYFKPYVEEEFAFQPVFFPFARAVIDASKEAKQ